jgi:hypothetical protein
VLKLSNGLRSLSLEDNSIKNPGAEELAAAIEVNGNLHLHTLLLSCNRIDDSGCQVLSHAMYLLVGLESQLSHKTVNLIL